MKPIFRPQAPEGGLEHAAKQHANTDIEGWNAMPCHRIPLRESPATSRLSWRERRGTGRVDQSDDGQAIEMAARRLTRDRSAADA